MFKHVFLKDPNNLVISPFSVKLLMNLLVEATAPETDTQRELTIISSKTSTTASIRNDFEKIFKSLNVSLICGILKILIF